MKNYSLSLAIIVRNSEKVLGRLLDSVGDLPDEIIVVDTGSDDNTKEIAKKYTDKVFDFPWEDNFAQARNYSFSKCTKDWVLWLDSDDVINPVELEKIKQLDLAHTDKTHIMFLYDYAQDANGNTLLTFYRERIIKRDKNFCVWKGWVHEFIPFQNYSKEQIIITHKRVGGDQSMRNIGILKKAISYEKVHKKGQDCDKELLARYYFYLGKEYYDVKDWAVNKGKNLERWAIEAYQDFLAMEDYYWWEDAAKASLSVAKYYYDKDEGLFKKYLLQSMKVDATRAETYYYMGIFYSDRQRWEQALSWYRMCLEVKKASDLLDYYEDGFNTWKPCMQLCLCYNGLGDIKTAYYWNERAIAYGVKDDRLFHNREILCKSLPVGNSYTGPEGSRPLVDGNGKKLNLGCGKKTIEGFENADSFKADYVDAVYNLYAIPYLDNTISEIRSEHALEHVGRVLGAQAIKEWARVLRPGGVLILKIPDFELCIRKYLETMVDPKSEEWFKFTIYGYQKALAGEADEAQYHRWGYTKENIRGLLEANGFIIDYLENYDGWDTPSIAVRALKKLRGPRVRWVAPKNWDAAQTRIRVLNVNRWLRSKGFDSDVLEPGSAESIFAYGFDIAIVGKSFTDQDLNDIWTLKGNGIKVYCDICEDILVIGIVQKIVSACDKVICCSALLAEKVKLFNKEVLVIEDAFET